MVQVAGESAKGTSKVVTDTSLQKFKKNRDATGNIRARCARMKVLMRCRVCESLNREHDLMCEVEATLSLSERYKLLNPSEEPLEASVSDARELLLLSRKRQASIRSRLESHKAKAHSA